MKPSFPNLLLSIQLIEDRTPILQIEAELTQINKKIRKSQDNIYKIQHLEEFQSFIQKTHQQITLIRQKYLLQHKEAKQSVEAMLTTLQKQLQNYKKDWQRLRSQCQEHLTEQVQEIRILKSSNQIHLNSLTKTTAASIREDISQLNNEFKQCKKNRNLRTSKLFTHLESVRSNLSMLISQEEEKRNQYNNIIYGLLEKTCENATSSLRRRVC